MLLLTLAARAAVAEDFEYELGGHAKYQISRISYGSQDLQAVAGRDRVTESNIDLRATSSLSYSKYRAELDVEFLGASSDAKDLPDIPGLGVRTRALGLGRTLIDDSRRLFDLTSEVADGDDFGAVLRVDRMSAGYFGENVVVIGGRQAVSWGGGLAFHVLDLFNPFTPTEIDKDYKTGDDMLYGQYLFSDGGDVQLLSVVRRDPLTSSVLSTQSSFAGKWHTNVNGIDVDLVLAQHYDEPHFGGGIAAPVFDGVLRADAMLVDVENGDAEFSLITNYDRSWIFAGFNMYGFVEYFHSGFGVSESSYLDPPLELAERLLRGELFTLGRDYMSVGLQTELTPRWNWFVSLINNLHDESGVVQTRASFDATQNLQVLAGVDVPWGPKGSEFGGIAVDNEVYLAFGWDMYARITYYF